MVLMLPPQGPLEIGPGCLLSGLTASSSSALQGCPLRDVVLQGHHVRLRDLSCRVFTLSGRLDDWQVRQGEVGQDSPRGWGVTNPSVSPPRAPLKLPPTSTCPGLSFSVGRAYGECHVLRQSKGPGSLGFQCHPTPLRLHQEASWPPQPLLPTWNLPSSLRALLMGSPSSREGDLWDAQTPPSSRCLLSARLFPVLHASEALGLEDVLWLLAPTAGPGGRLARWRAAWRMSWEELLPCLDKEAELGARRALFFLQGQRKVRRVLLGRQDGSLLPLIRSAVHEGYHEAVLGTLDEGKRVAAPLQEPPGCSSRAHPSPLGSACCRSELGWCDTTSLYFPVASTADDAGVAARALACIADVLGCLAQGEGGLRSGPAANTRWASAFRRLESGDIAGGVRELAAERQKWMSG